jgi:hypothetical protein
LKRVPVNRSWNHLASRSRRHQFFLVNHCIFSRTAGEENHFPAIGAKRQVTGDEVSLVTWQRAFHKCRQRVRRRMVFTAALPGERLSCRVRQFLVHPHSSFSL